MAPIEDIAGFFALAFVRYAPALVLPGFSPLRWAPTSVRVVLASSFAWMTVLSMPESATAGRFDGAIAWAIAALGEFAVGIAFGLAMMVPQAALHTSGWLIDIQAGLGASTLFDPAGQGDSQSLLGMALMLLGTALFFALDLHLDLYRGLVASCEILPLGAFGARPNAEGFFGLVGSGFLLALMVAMPVLLGMFVVDVGVAYATRSMPQANVFFLALPLKVIAAVLLLASSLRYAPALMLRLYQDAFARVPTMLGT